MSGCGAGGRCILAEWRKQQVARLSRYDGEAMMLELEAMFAGFFVNVKLDDWTASGMACALIVARWPNSAKKAFSEKVTPGANSLLARQ